MSKSRFGEFGRYAVIPDIHGHDGLLEQVIEYYPEDVGLISLGDVFDSKATVTGIKNCMDILSANRHRVQLLLGNHEWAPVAAITSTKRYRSEWIDGWRGYEKNTLQSYEVRGGPSEQTADKFKEALKASGHLDMLLGAPLYFETDEFIAVHAGLSRALSWKTQKASLDEAKKAMLKGEINPEEFPVQLYSHELAGDKRKPIATDKILITGHTPSKDPLSERITGNGSRVRLASRIQDSGGQLFVWESWSQKIQPFNKASGYSKQRRHK